MSEEWGSFIIKADETFYEMLDESPNDLESAFKYLSEYVGLTNHTEITSHIDQLDKIKFKKKYVVFKYSCANWLPLLTHLYNEAEDIEFYAYNYDEYGCNHYFSINNKADKMSAFVDYEGDEYDEEEAGEQLGNWVASFPKKKLFKKFNPLEKWEYCLPKSQKSIPIEFKGEVDLFCYFTCKSEEAHITSGLKQEFLDYHYNLYDDYARVDWLPLSRRDKRKALELINVLSKVSVLSGYIQEFYGGRSFPYKIYQVKNGSIDLIFDTDDYQEYEFDYLNLIEHPELESKVNWMALEFEDISELQQKQGIKSYVNAKLEEADNVKAYVEKEEASQAEKSEDDILKDLVGELFGSMFKK